MKKNVLMVGVDQLSHGGMWTVAKSYIENKKYNENINLYYIPTATRRSKIIKIFFFITALFKIAWVLLTKKIDIVHIHMAEGKSVDRQAVVIKISRIAGCKIIVQMHAGPFMNWYEKTSESMQRKARRTLNAADYLLVLGEYFKEQMAAIVEPQKMLVLYNGIECPPQNEYSLKATDVSFFAYLRKTKGIYELLEAIEEIEDQLPKETKVNLCGVSDEFDIEQYLIEHNLNNRIIYHGWVDGQKRSEIERNTAINVLPTYSEGLSMTVLESMARGIPIITTDVTTMPELLGGIIDLCPVGNAKSLAQMINNLMSHPEMRMRVSQMEFDRVSHKFSVESMIDNTLEIYTKIMVEQQKKIRGHIR
jgi:glycosyltransferase involved in cell wall biosynthesis